MEQLLYSINDSCKILGISRAGLYRTIKRGDIKTVTVGARQKLTAEALRDYVKQLEENS